MKKIFFFLIGLILIQYLFYKFVEINNKKYFCKEKYIGFYVCYSINGIYLTRSGGSYPNHTRLILHKKKFTKSLLFSSPPFLARNYIMVDKEIRNGFFDNIELKSPMDYFMITDIDFDNNIEILFYNKEHANIILEITPQGYVQLEKNIMTKVILNIIAWGGPLRRQIFDGL